MRIQPMIVVLAVMLAASSAQAAALDISRPYESYGHVWNTDSGLQNGNAVQYCASTATINSFAYLENQYPLVYGTSLTGGPAGIVAARNLLVNGWNVGTPRPGMGGPATYQGWWENKVWYIEDFAPNTTTFEGMVLADTTGWYRAQDLTQGYPTWQFLWDQLLADQDVEIGIQGPFLTEGHALTLTSLHVDDDINGNDTWDPATETASLDFLDPNWPLQLYTAQLSVNPLQGNRLEFTLNDPGNAVQLVYIDLAYAESVPEPAAVGLVAICMLGLALRRRRMA